jgi:large conductance mechanosensitive channel
VLAEFKDFLKKGDIITIAVGLVMALTFKTIIDAIIEGVITPIVAAIAGKSNFADIGFDIGDARISIGLVIAAIINFVIVAFILFMIVKAYNKMKAADGPAGPTEVDLLTEIRDQLKSR